MLSGGCDPGIVLSFGSKPRRAPSLRRVPLGRVPLHHRYYERALTPHRPAVSSLPHLRFLHTQAAIGSLTFLGSLLRGRCAR